MNNIIRIIIAITVVLYITAFAGYKKQHGELIFCFGAKGTGKTCDIAKQAIKYVKKGYKVYSTVKIPGTYYFEPKDIETKTFENKSVIFIDEVGLIWSNRDYKNFKKGEIEYFKYQRQYGNKVIMYSQSIDADKKIRELIDKIYIVRKIGNYTIKTPVKKTITTEKDRDGNGHIAESLEQKPLQSKITYRPIYYKYFKSENPPEREIITSIEIPKTEKQKKEEEKRNVKRMRNKNRRKKLVYTLRRRNKN